MFGPSFNSVGNETGMKLKDLGFPASETGDGILLIDTATAQYTELTYVTAEGAADEGLADGAGWYNFTGDDPVFENERVITRGCAFWMYLVNGEVVTTTAGEVKNTFTRTFPNRLYSALSNPFPTQFKLKDLNWPATDTGDGMLWIDPATSAYTDLTYVTAEGASDEGLSDGAGWYDFTGDDPVFANNWELAPGQGVWIYPVNGSVTATASISL